MVMITSRLQRIWENSSTNISYKDIHNQLVYGFELSWLPSFAKKDEWGYFYCVNGSNNMVHCDYVKYLFHTVDDHGSISNIRVIALLLFGMLLSIVSWSGIKFILGIPFVIAVLICKWRRRHLSMYNIIEEFLQANNDLMPIRYLVL